MVHPGVVVKTQKHKREEQREEEEEEKSARIELESKKGQPNGHACMFGVAGKVGASVWGD